MKIVRRLLAFGVSMVFLQNAASQSGGLAISEDRVSPSTQEAHDRTQHQKELNRLRENSIGIGSGELVFLRGATIGELPNEFSIDDTDHSGALKETLDSLAPLLGDLDGRVFIIEKVIDLPAQKLIRFHQIVEGEKLPSSSIFVNKNGEIQSVALYSMAPEKAQNYLANRLQISELRRSFEYYAADYFEKLGVTLTVSSEQVHGPTFRYLAQDASEEIKYRYVADFFFDGFLFILDAITGELVTAGHLGASDLNSLPPI